MIKIYFESNKLEPPKSETYWGHSTIDLIERPEYTRYISVRDKLVSETTLKDSDYVFVPFKWNGDPKFANNTIYKQSSEANKKIIAFFNDDHEDHISIPNKNFYLFRTSTSTKTRKRNEIVMPAFSEEYSFEEPSQKAIKHRVISFCGNIQDPYRYPIFSELEKETKLAKQFIYRNGFWAPEILDKNIAKRQFIVNMRNGLFGICIRGKGNFSYRLYETLALGRIPIIINSDLCLPLAKSIDWKQHVILIEKSEMSELTSRIDAFLKDADPIKICQSNKDLYDEYFSPFGLLKHFDLYLAESDV